MTAVPPGEGRGEQGGGQPVSFNQFFFFNFEKYSNVNTFQPPGLVAIISALQTAYPNQRNPAQVTAVVKYWLGELF